MADISRMASPMSLCEEDLFDIHKSVEKKKRELSTQQNQTASFVIGSVDIINERISKLTSQLSLYESKLAIESQSSYNNEILALGKRKTPLHRTRSARGRENQDAEMLEGALSHDEVFSSGERSLKKRLFAKKSDEPQLVELQQYPGFDPIVLTPLPHSLETGTVLDRVVAAQTDLPRKPSYGRQFIKVLYSKSQRAILQDAFWWFFLNRFHPGPDVQSRLFKRIAKQFIVLYLMPFNLRYKNIFFMNYGNILAQSVYCTFCLAFPQSWRQFDEHEFKDILLGTCVQWVSGIRPRPGVYDEWNYAALEPAGMRKDESINHDESETIVPSVAGPLTGKLSPSLSRDSAFKSKSDSKSKLSANRSDVVSGLSSHKTKAIDSAEPKSVEPAMLQKKKVDRGAKKKQFVRCFKNASCTAGKAIEFEKCAFNLYGGSPLLSEFFQSRNMNPTTGVDHLVRRTQIQSYFGPRAKTYQDIIDESSAEVKRISGEFQRLNSEFFKETQAFTNKQKSEETDHTTKSKKILSKPRQVRRLSTLILMDMKKDQNERENTKVGATAALNAALASVSTE